MMMKILILFVMVLFFVGGVSATDIWVEEPVTAVTMNSAIASAQPGDVVIVPNGNYSDICNGWNKIIIINNSGALGNMITLRPEGQGGVIFKDAFKISVYADNWIIRDFWFDDVTSYDPSAIISLPIKISEAENIVITNCYFKDIGKRYLASTDGSVGIVAGDGSQNVTISYNSFVNWPNGNGISVLESYNLHIHHNYFTHPFEGGLNEAIHLGGDPKRIVEADLNAIVEYNYFYQCEGDGEIIAIKSSNNSIRYNVFDSRGYTDSVGCLSLRAGNDHLIEGNHFYETSSGIIIKGEGHIIKNNYIAGTDLAGIWISPGFTTEYLVDPSGNPAYSHNYTYVRSKDIQMVNNIVVNTGNYGIFIGKKWPNSDSYIEPENLYFRDNIVMQNSGYNVYDDGHTGDFEWNNNILYANDSAVAWTYVSPGVEMPLTGITVVNEPPVIPQVNLPVTEADVGVNWLRDTLTCQSLGYSCCDSCESGEQPQYDGDCPGVCCGVCTSISTCGDADSDFSGVVSITEVINYITEWKSGNVNINDLINGITEWKNGC